MVWFLLFEFPVATHRGLMGTPTRPLQSGAKRTGQAKGRRLPLGKRPWQLDRHGGGFKRPPKKAVGRTDQMEEGNRAD